MAHSLRFIDAAAVGLAVPLAFRAGVSVGAWPPQPVIEPVILLSVATSIAFLALAERLHVYHAWRTESLSSELVALAEVAFYSTGIGCLFSAAMHMAMPASLNLIALVLGSGLLVALRLAMRLVIRRLRRRGKDV